MANSDKELKFNNSRYDQKYDNSIFEDDNVDDDIDSLQKPYPSDDDLDEDDITDADIDEDTDDLHEYEDNDHPHQYTPPSAGLDNKVASANDRTNAFEQQNPLQSTYPSSDSDR